MFNRQIFFVFAFMLIFVSFSHAWANESFPYRKKIDITSATQLTDYQVALNITYNSNMQIDFDDIRFYASNDATKLSYWIEQKVDGQWAYVWVKVPTIDSNSYIYMYYGNPFVISESNGDDTFIFFDDFLGSSLNTSKWSNTGTISVSSGIAQFNSGNLISKIQIYTTDKRAVARMKLNTLSSNTDTFNIFNNGSVSYPGIRTGVWWDKTYLQATYINAGGTETRQDTSIPESSVVGSYHRFELKIASNNLYWYYDFTLVKNNTVVLDWTSTRNITISIDTQPAQIDYVFAAKASQTEPSYSIGSEEVGSTISIFYPTNGIYINQSQININFSLNYYEPNDCNLYINGNLNDTKTNLQAGNYSFTNKTFSDGQHNIKINCSNAGAQSGIISFTIDTTKPSINLISPYDNQFINSTNIQFNITVSDVNLNYTNISIYDLNGNLLNSTTTSNSTIYSSLNIQNLTNVSMLITSYDKANNSDSVRIYLSNVLNWTPLNGIDYDNNLSVSFRYGAAINCSYSIYGPTNVSNSFSINNSEYSTIHTLYPGTYSISMQCYSGTNASNVILSENRDFSVNVLPYLAQCSNSSANWNITAKDELTSSNINFSYTIDFTYSITNGTHTFTSQNQYFTNTSLVPFVSFCFTPRTNVSVPQYPITINTSITYSNPSYSIRNSRFTTYILSSQVTNTTLWLANGSYYTFTVLDQFGNAIKDVYFEVKFLGNIVQTGYTNIDGNILLSLTPLNSYSISLTKTGYNPINFTFVPGSTTSTTVRMSLITSSGEYYYVYLPGAFNFSCQKPNSTSWSCSVSDASSYLKYSRMICYNMSSNNSVVFDVNSSASTNTLTANLDNSSKYLCEYYLHFDTETLKRTAILGISDIISSTLQDNPSTYNHFGLFAVIAITLGLTFLFANSVILMPLGLALGLIIGSMMHLIVFNTTTLFIILFAVVIYLIWLRR